MSNRPSWLSAVQIPLRNGARVRLVVLGMRIVAGDGMDYRKAATAGVSFWVGYGFEGGYLFTDQMSPFFAEMLGNDMTSGDSPRCCCRVSSSSPARAASGW